MAPPPKVAPLPPPPPVAPPPPGPPMPSKLEQSKDATTSQNPNPPPRAMKRERSMLDEIKEFQENKKLKSVDSSNLLRERPVPRPRTSIPQAENVAPKSPMNVLDIMKNVEGFEMTEEDEKDDTGEWSE